MFSLEHATVCPFIVDIRREIGASTFKSEELDQEFEENLPQTGPRVYLTRQISISMRGLGTYEIEFKFASASKGAPASI